MEELRICIEQALAPNTPPATRDCANRHLNSLQNDPHSIALCLEAFSHPAAVHPNVLSFLLNVAKSQVILFHQQWPTAVRQQFRQVMRQCYTMPMFCGQSRTSEKVAAVLVEVVVREWPQLWPDAFDFIYGLLSSDSQVNVKLALLFLSSFLTRLRCEADESQCGGWSVERKAEVGSAFNEVLPGFISWLHQNVNLMEPLIVKVYGQLAGWAKIDRHDLLVDWCLRVISESPSSQVQEEAMEAVGELASRNLHSNNEDDNRLVNYLVAGGLTRFNGLLEAAVGSDYFRFRQLIDIFTAILCKLSTSDNNVKDKVYLAIMDLQLYLSHPSLYVRSALVMCLLDLFRACSDAGTTDGTNGAISAMQSETIDQCMPLLMAILAEDPKKTYKCADNQNDFDDFADFQKIGEHLKSRIGELFGAFARASPTQMRTIILQQSNKWLSVGGPTASHNKWQMAVLFLIQTASLLASASDGDGDVVLSEVYCMVVQLLHSNIQAHDDKLVEEALYGCKSLCLAISTLPIYNQSFAVFKHFSCLPTEGSISIRCRAMAALHQMAVHQPSLFAEHLMPQYLQLAASLRGQRELRSWIETTLWMAACSTNSCSPQGEMNMEYVKAVFVPLLAQLEQLHVLRSMDGRQFAEHIGLPYYLQLPIDSTQQHAQPEAEGTKNNRLLLVNLLTLLQVTSKAIKDAPISAQVQSVVEGVFVPVVLDVVRVLNEAHCLCVGQRHYVSIFGDQHNEDLEANDQSEAESELLYMNRWITHIRTVCHMVIGYLGKHVNVHDRLQILTQPFDYLSSTDRCSLIRNAVAPIARHTCGRDPLTISAVSASVRTLRTFAESRADALESEDEEKTRFMDFANALSWLICDVLKRNISAITADVLCCSQILLRFGNTTKWCSFLVDNMHDLCKDNERFMFNEISQTVLSLLSEEQFVARQSNLLQLLFDLFKWNVWMGFHQVDHLLCSDSRVDQRLVELCRESLSQLTRDANAKKLRDSKQALTTAIKPLLPAPPSHSNKLTTVKKLIPEKLVILSKLRREWEAEQVENEAIASAADLFQ